MIVVTFFLITFINCKKYSKYTVTSIKNDVDDNVNKSNVLENNTISTMDKNTKLSSISSNYTLSIHSTATKMTEDRKKLVAVTYAILYNKL